VPTQFSQDDLSNPSPDSALNTLICSLPKPPLHADQLSISSDRFRSSLRQTLLRKLQTELGGGPASGTRRAAITAPWIVDEAFAKEFSNWTDAFIVVQNTQLPPNCNYVQSHSFYRIKPRDDGSLSLKTRIVIHGNEDKEKELIRKDTESCSFSSTRFILAISTSFHFDLSFFDVSGAYLQSGPIHRDVFVRPPNEWNGPSHCSWELIKLPYGICEAGRQWQLTSDLFLSSLGFRIVPGLPQVFTLNNKTQLTCVVGKITDDIIAAGSPPTLTWFGAQLARRFSLGKALIAPTAATSFNGATLHITAASIIMDMRGYLADRLPIYIALSQDRRCDINSPATPSELAALRRCAGVLNHCGMGTHPPAAFAASFIQQSTGPKTVSHLLRANALASEVLRLDPIIAFRRAPATFFPTAFEVLTYSDASFAHTLSAHGQRASLTILAVHAADGTTASMYYALDWKSQKQGRVSSSTLGADLLACAQAERDNVSWTHAIRYTINAPVTNRIIADSRGLADHLVHPGNHLPDVRLEAVAASLRESLATADLRLLQWVSSRHNLSDGLTKRNPTAWCYLLTQIRCTCWVLGFLGDEGCLPLPEL
jgi:hypothetical protein